MFTANKTQVFIGTGLGTGQSFYVSRTSTTVITVGTSEFNSGNPSFDDSDGLLLETAITIVVFP